MAFRDSTPHDNTPRRDKPSPAADKKLPRRGLAVIPGLVLVLSLAWIALQWRWQAGGHPSGDEGSWMAVAAQLARGEGFTTLWLEHHWQKPYALPRPDDFRYPALTVALALGFLAKGIGYATALHVTAWIFLAFLLAFFLQARRLFGLPVAAMALPLSAFSLLQLRWNSQVYTEGLFALALTGVIAAAWKAAKQPQRVSPWLCLGAALGFLYGVRPNGILMLVGLPWLFFSSRRGYRDFSRPLFITALAWLAVAGPWLLRSYFHFGNPFHIAGSAGLLRDAVGEDHNQGLGQFWGRHDWLYPATRIAAGFRNFLSDLHEFENGLEITPLALLASGLGFHAWRILRARDPAKTRKVRWSKLVPASLRIPGFTGFFITGFAASLAACAYASFSSWAGLRYGSAFMPWIYALALAYLPGPIRLGTRRLALMVPALSLSPKALIRGGVFAFFTVLMLMPVAHAHHYYWRHFRDSHALSDRVAVQTRHIRKLGEFLPRHGTYYAKSLCQINFATTYRCIGLQELYDTTWFERAEAAFAPSLLVMRPEEERDADMIMARKRISQGGIRCDTLAQTSFALYLSLRRKSDQP